MTAASQLLPLDADRARQLTDEVKADAAALWAKLLQLYEGNAHKALGYTSWAKYCRTEFEMSDASAYRMLQGARVLAQLPIGSQPSSESVARELAPLLDEPDAMRETWAEVVDLHGSRPTAVQVRDHVNAPRTRPRSPVTIAFRDAIVDLDRSVGRIQRVLADDRISRHRDSLRARYLSDLRRLQAAVAEAIEAIGGDG